MQKKNIWALVGLVAVVFILAAVVNQNNPGEARGGAAGGGSTVYCSDSDGGANFNVQGTTMTYTLKKSGAQSVLSSVSDSCSSSNSVTEYSCNGSTVVSTVGTCSGGCSNGACLAPTGPDTTPPTFGNMVPTNGSTQYVADGMPVYGVYANVSFSDDVGLGSLVLYDNGSIVATGSCNNQTSCDTGNYITTLGTHSIYGVATDTSGNTSTGPTNTFTVVQTTCTDMPSLCPSGGGTY